jgi:ABC-type dipeptide/oligopeptide/nickel transport system ATPase subunit
MITHDLARGLNLCDRIAILNRGKIAHEVERASINSGDFLKLYTEVTQGR